MALLLAADLKASKEAEDAGVNNVANAFATNAITVAEAYVLRLAGYTADTFDFVSTDQDYIFARQATLLLAVRSLATAGLEGVAAPPGGYLTGVQSEGTAFTFFTPTDSSTGYTDVDRLINLIAKGPLAGTSGLVSVQLEGPAYSEIDPDISWSDLL